MRLCKTCNIELPWNYEWDDCPGCISWEEEEFDAEFKFDKDFLDDNDETEFSSDSGDNKKS